MNPLKCEMCTSNDIIKENGYYVCQSCGTKYTVEEARKLFVEGTVTVKGSVSIDRSQELKNLFVLARRARFADDAPGAVRYYEQILLKDPSCWEACLYSAYYRAQESAEEEPELAAKRLSKMDDIILSLIKEKVEASEDRADAVKEVRERTLEFAEDIFESSETEYKAEEEPAIESTQQHAAVSMSAAQLLYRFGDGIMEQLGSEYAKENAVPCWKKAIAIHKSVLDMTDDVDAGKATIKEHVSKIRMFEPSFSLNAKKTGCYIATAVYGSYDCPEVWTLRRYRDQRLAETSRGRAFIRTYYFISPTLVRLFGGTNRFKNLLKPALDKKVKKLREEGLEDTPYQDNDL